MTVTMPEIPGTVTGLDAAQKRKIYLRGKLDGKGFHRALDALALAARYHIGTRKDGVTPELDHQISIALYVLTLAIPGDELETLLCIILLHDIREDYSKRAAVPAGLPPVTEAMIREQFGAEVSETVELLSKVTDGIVKERGYYFEQMCGSWKALLVKLCDRLHNLSTMHGVFTRGKQIEYLEEAAADILPLASYGSRNFSRYSAAFENVKFTLKLAMALLHKLNENPDEAEAA